MNKNIKLAVAGAVLALSASAANAGIIIPAGDWTLDISGNVNTFATWTKFSGDLRNSGDSAGFTNNSWQKTQSNLTTGLLPNYLSVGGSTRQNDLDVAFLISINPGSSTTSGGKQSAHQENRQAYLTFGDKSWGSIKVGKDLGIFASDAILNDMTLLGVGSGAGALAGNTTTLGHIGAGYIYADWKSQIAYTTPNFSGFQATVGIAQGFNSNDPYNPDDGGGSVYPNSYGRSGAGYAYEGKASYSFAANDMTGKVWVSGIYQTVKDVHVSSGNNRSNHGEAADIGATVNVAGFGLTGYYYAGQGIGSGIQFNNGHEYGYGKSRDSDGGYVQVTYVLPTKTKVGVSYGISNLDPASSYDYDMYRTNEKKLTTVGAYHPLTKHLNLVAEYDHEQVINGWNSSGQGTANTVSLGAILFF